MRVVIGSIARASRLACRRNFAQAWRPALLEHGSCARPLRPALRRPAGIDLLHRDAILHRANQPAEIAPHALRFIHARDAAECVGCNLCWLVCPEENCITMEQVDTG